MSSVCEMKYQFTFEYFFKLQVASRTQNSFVLDGQIFLYSEAFHQKCKCWMYPGVMN